MISVRKVQAALGIGYALVALFAVVQSLSIASLVIAVALAVFAYVTGIVVPDILLPSDKLFRICGIGLVVLAIGIAAALFGGDAGSGFALAVMSVCAGNRIKAAGVGAGLR